MRVFGVAKNDIDFINDLFTNNKQDRFHLFENEDTGKWNIIDYDEDEEIIDKQDEVMDLIFEECCLEYACLNEEQKRRYIKIGKKYGYNLEDLDYCNCQKYDKEEEVEINEIVKNDLIVKSLKQLSYSIYQADDLIESEEKANECIKYLTEHLQRVYEFLDEDIYELCEDNEVMISCIHETMQEKGIDVYQIGDIINFLDTINIKEEREIK